MFGSGFKTQKLSTNLKLVMNRLKLLERKKTELATKSRKEIAGYIADGKIDRARIRVEHIIREDYLVEAMEMIEMYCDLLDARMGLIQSKGELDEGLEMPIATMIWCTSRLVSEVPELRVITDQLTAKYGKEFALSCQSNTLNNVNEKVIQKLSVNAPPPYLVEKYIEEIAKSFNVPYISDPEPVEVSEDLLPSAQNSANILIDLGGNVPNSWGPAPSALPAAPPSAHIYPPPPVYMPMAPQPHHPQQPAVPYLPPAGPYNPQSAEFHMKPSTSSEKPPLGDPPAAGFLDLPELPDVPRSRGESPSNEMPASGDVDFDDLTKRFEALKKKK